MTSQVLFLLAVMTSSCSAARMKRPEDKASASLMQSEAKAESEHQLHVTKQLETRKKAVASSGVQAMRTPNGDEQQQFLAAHNKYRCMHGANNVVWSDAMAEDASNYISAMTRMTHSDSYNIAPPAGPAGENLYMASWAATPDQAVDAWYSEVNDCQGGPAAFTDGCRDGVGGAVTGHLTVMIWKGVKEIGCAFSDAKAGLIICRYKAGDTLTSDTPNINGGSGNYVNQVFPRTKSESECAAGGSGSGGTGDTGGSTGDDSGDSTGGNTGGSTTTPIDYEHCVTAGSIGQCGQCTHSTQCSGSSFCCPFMKKCVPTSSTGCQYPIANCRPPCHDNSADGAVNCASCTDASFPTTWLGKTCGAGGGPLPTPAPTTPAPTPVPPTPSPPGSCADTQSAGNCQNWAGRGFCTQSYVSFMNQNCCGTCTALAVANPTPSPTAPTGAATMGCVVASGTGQCTIQTACSGQTQVKFTCASRAGWTGTYTVTMPGTYTWDLSGTCNTCSPLISVQAA